IRGLRELPGIGSDRLLEPEAPANLCERFLAADAVVDVRAHSRRGLRVEFAARKCLKIVLARTTSPLVHGSRPSQPRNAYGLSPRAGPNATGRSRNGHLGGHDADAAISDDGTHTTTYVRGKRSLWRLDDETRVTEPVPAPPASAPLRSPSLENL